MGKKLCKKYGLEELLKTCKSDGLEYEFKEWYHNLRELRKEKSSKKVPKYVEVPKYIEDKIIKEDFRKISLKESETSPEDAAKFRGYPFEVTQFCIRCGHNKTYTYIPLEDESNKSIAYKCSGCNCISYFTKKSLEDKK